MAKKVSIKNPDFEDGIIFDVGGLAVPNGGSVTLDHDAELSFFARHGQNVAEFFQGDPQIKVSGDSELTKTERDTHLPGQPEMAPNLDKDMDVEPGEPAKEDNA